MTKIRTVVYLEKKEADALKKLSEKTGAPLTELVRRALAEWLKHNK
jgi:hypothetical protein